MKNAGKVIAETDKFNKKRIGLQKMSNVTRLMLERSYERKRIMALKGDNSKALKALEQFYDDAIDLEQTKSLEASVNLDNAPRNTTTDAEAIKERQRLLTEIKLQALMESSQAIGGFLDGEFQREITREQNKTNALNNELRERLNNENLSKSERKGIQLEIARNDEALRKKQEVIEKKRFKMQKAINVSQALLSTYLAVAQVQANPLDLNPVTKGISMAATLAVGLANVATLSRQQFQSSAGATSTAGALGGGGSGGGNNREFRFNLAGRSTNNQLAETLQNRFDQPIRTYVVSRDMTNQQQFDEEIIGQTSMFGD